ncbi:unnamed protein product [Nezara viridula]|uniref:Uncharacterized protein n=1 Tax=Nezara viridula TaxID=85310 RepID=A0A9P0HRD9_NEZVI|nr:unnamed protein product [Nezara viridula]
MISTDVNYHSIILRLLYDGNGDAKSNHLSLRPPICRSAWIDTVFACGSRFGIRLRGGRAGSVDEPPDDTSMPVDDYIRTSEPEEGFKGGMTYPWKIPNCAPHQTDREGLMRQRETNDVGELRGAHVLAAIRLWALLTRPTYVLQVHMSPPPTPFYCLASFVLFIEQYELDDFSSTPFNTIFKRAGQCSNPEVAHQNWLYHNALHS